MTIHTIPLNAFDDNYIWAIVKDNSSEFIVIDPGDGKVVKDFADSQGLTLTHILVTHHHFDHIGGLNTLKKYAPNCIVYTPHDSRISISDHPLDGSDTISIESLNLYFKIIETPGHTSSHICYYEPNHQLLFCGDTLFSAGCGRLFEGTAHQMYHSLNQLMQLPEETLIFPAHEYTQANLKFAQYLEPNNQAITDKLNALKSISISLPSTLKEEKSFNPFLRVHQPTFIKALEAFNISGDSVTIFSAIRKLKDLF